MTQQATADKSMAKRLQSAVNHVNALFDEIHTAGLVVSVNSPVVQLPNGIKTMRLQLQVLRPISEQGSL